MEANANKGEKKMLLDYYEEALKELEELEINLNNLSNNEIHHNIRSLIDRGWLQIETLFGGRQNKEKIQKHFNEMLKVTPMSKVQK